MVCIVNFSTYIYDTCTHRLYHYKDLGIFSIMGMVGGILGATFNQLNRYLTIFRLKYIITSRHKIVELLCITGLMAIFSFCVPFAGHCKSRPPLDPTTEIFTYASTLRPFLCRDPNSYNEVASLYFNSWDDSLRILFHLPMVRAVFSMYSFLREMGPLILTLFLRYVHLYHQSAH